MGKVKLRRVRCQLVLDAKGKQLIRCKNPAKHRLPDGTPLCKVHWRMSAEAKNPLAKIMPFRKPRRLTPEIVGEPLSPLRRPQPSDQPARRRGSNSGALCSSCSFSPYFDSRPRLAGGGPPEAPSALSVSPNSLEPSHILGLRWA